MHTDVKAVAESMPGRSSSLGSSRNYKGSIQNQQIMGSSATNVWDHVSEPWLGEQELGKPLSCGSLSVLFTDEDGSSYADISRRSTMI